MPNRSPPLPLTTRLFIAALSAATDFSRRRDGTVNRRLLSILDPPASPSPVPSHGVRSADVIVDPTRDLYFRLFLPNSESPNPSAAAAVAKIPVIVFFHGGGFAFLSPASRAYDIVCRRFARKLNAVVVSVNYRRSPEHKCPAPYVDGVDVLRYLDGAENSEDLSVADLSDCFLMGDSAGGNIVHHVAKEFCKQKNWRRVSLSGLIPIQPWFGGEERMEAEIRLKNAPLVSLERTDWLWKAFLPDGSDRDHPAANVFGPRDLEGVEEGFPPAMVVVGGWDPLQDWQRRYADELRRRGVEVRLVEYEDAVHAFYVLPGIKEAGLLIEEVKEFINRHKK